MARDLELLRGTLDVLILKALSFGPRHGYAVAEWLESSTGDLLQVGEGSLYPALHRLEERGWVRSSWGLSENNRRARFYELTTEGRRSLKSEAAWWARFAGTVTAVLARGAEPAGPHRMTQGPMWRRYLRFFGPDSRADLDEEFRFHLDMRRERLSREGLGDEQARAEAIRRFGDVSTFREECERIDASMARTSHRGERMGMLGQDLRFTARQLRRSPLVTLAVMLVLGPRHRCQRRDLLPARRDPAPAAARGAAAGRAGEPHQHQRLVPDVERLPGRGRRQGGARRLQHAIVRGRRRVTGPRWCRGSSRPGTTSRSLARPRRWAGSSARPTTCQARHRSR